MNLSDQDFLYQFEQKTLPAEDFDHRGHLRLAWLYLNLFPLDVAIVKTTKGIEAYANSLGATGKFHHTLTEAIIRIMHARVLQGGQETLDEFLSRNPELVRNIRGEVLRYYSEERLNSPTAKRSFCQPDIRSFEETN